MFMFFIISSFSFTFVSYFAFETLLFKFIFCFFYVAEEKDQTRLLHSMQATTKSQEAFLSE